MDVVKQNIRTQKLTKVNTAALSMEQAIALAHTAAKPLALDGKLDFDGTCVTTVAFKFHIVVA